MQAFFSFSLSKNVGSEATSAAPRPGCSPTRTMRMATSPRSRPPPAPPTVQVGKLIGVALFALVLLAIGLVCLVWPEKVREYGQLGQGRARGIAKFNPFPGWEHTRSYIISLRLGGVLAIAAGGFLLYVLYLSFKYPGG